MYYVYQISIGESKYVGCTNNIRRRKDQHNENARKDRGKFGRFLRDNGIVLCRDDIEVVTSFENRAKALAFERALTMKHDENGVELLNDNYTKECTRKGKNLGNTAKEYVVVNHIAHTVTPVKGLRQYCIQNNLPYKTLQRTTGKGKYCLEGYKVFPVAEWDALVDKKRYISGAFISDAKAAARESQSVTTSKRYEVRFPDGHTEIIKNADKFASEHNLTPGTFHATYRKGRPTKGYQIITRI